MALLLQHYRATMGTFSTNPPDPTRHPPHSHITTKLTNFFARTAYHATVAIFSYLTLGYVFAVLSIGQWLLDQFRDPPDICQINDFVIRQVWIRVQHTGLRGDELGFRALCCEVERLVCACYLWQALAWVGECFVAGLIEGPEDGDSEWEDDDWEEDDDEWDDG